MVKFPSKGNEGYKRILGHIDDVRSEGMSHSALSLILANDRIQVSEPTPLQGDKIV